MSEIKGFRLISGEDVLAEVESNEEVVLSYIFKNPVRIAMVPNSNTGEYKFAIVPLIPYSEDEEITISTDKVMFTFNVVSEVIEQYKQIFGTIITPTKNIIM